MTPTNHEHDAPEKNASEMEPQEEAAMDRALRAEDEADEATAEEVVARDEQRHDGTTSD